METRLARLELGRGGRKGDGISGIREFSVVSNL
jgi:hypothetical protein